MLRPNPLSELGAMADRPQPPNEVAAGVIGGRQAARDIKRRERRHLPEERAPSPHERCECDTQGGDRVNLETEIYHHICHNIPITHNA